MSRAGLLLWATLALASCARDPAVEASGRNTYLRYCAACHGSEGRGDGPVAGSLNTLVPDLTRIAQRNSGEFPADSVRQAVDGRSLVVAHGPRAMPVWGYELWVEEGGDIDAEREARDLIRRLVTYLAEIQDTERD